MLALPIRVYIFFSLVIPVPCPGSRPNRSGELRLTVTDPAGLPLPASVDLVSEANQFKRTYQCGSDGKVSADACPSVYIVCRCIAKVSRRSSEIIDMHSAVPLERKVTLGIAAIETTMVVSDAQTLLDPSRTASINRIGAAALRRPSLFASRPLHDRSGQHGTRLAAGSRRRAASPRLGVPDAIRRRRHSPYR